MKKKNPKKPLKRELLPGMYVSKPSGELDFLVLRLIRKLHNGKWLCEYSIEGQENDIGEFDITGYTIMENLINYCH